MLYRYALPDLGEGVAEGEIVEWLVEPGQTVAADEPIAELTTDKVDVVIPSPVAGTVTALCVEAGQVVPVGTVLAEIATEGNGVERAADAPGFHDLAARLGVEVGSGRRPESVRPRGRATIARRLTEAAAVPTVTSVDEADFEAVRASRYRPLVAVARAALVALRAHPELNAWGRPDGTCRKHERVQLGIATQAPTGLVVPVVHDADRITIDELAQALTEVTAAAREGRARPDDLRGSTFTITSVGRSSGLFATPLLNLPEVAILGLYRVQERAVVRDGAVVARHTAHLSVTFDHRAVDGVSAADFLSRVVALIDAWPEGIA